MPASDFTPPMYADFESRPGPIRCPYVARLRERRARFKLNSGEQQAGQHTPGVSADDATRGLGGSSSTHRQLENPQVVGTRLFEALFHPRSAASMIAAGRSYDRRQSGLRIRLRLSEEIKLPWGCSTTPATTTWR